MASSSIPPRPWRFDVFLSFRGVDTRKTIVSHLHSGLQSKGLKVFKDDRELRTGDSIPDELVKAIQESRFAVVVISQDYASSRWCLDELRIIMECKEKEMLTVFPIFYEVDPADVRHQKGTFAKAFGKHKVRETAEKVQKWREALRKVANLSGLDSRKCPDDDAMVHEIVGDVSSRLLSELPGDFGDIIGMDAYLKALDPLLKMGSEKEVRMIGIWGMGGIGKTTIAKCLYNKLSCEFLLHCFMDNIKQISRQRGLVYLQELFLSKILRQTDIKLEMLEEGLSSIQARLNHLKVLVILDDVDKLDQLHALSRETNWFGPGSIIIITTRDKGLLKSHGIERVHEVKCLGDDDALKLFNRFAFRGTPPTVDFLQLSIRAARLVQGLPLALRVFGSSLCGRTIEEWKTSIDKLRGDPCRDVMESLKASYDGLHVQEKVIFLCVACLFSEECVSHVTQLIDGKEPDVSNSLNRLAEKSLIDISSGWVIVHDLIQEMAKEIVYELSPSDLGGRRFLLDAEDIYNVLAFGTVTEAVKGISLNMSEMSNFPPDEWDFQRMQNLRFVKIYNTINCTEESLRSIPTLIRLPRQLRLLDWSNCPLTTLPSTFHAGCLVDLRLPFSGLEWLWEGTLSLGNLKRMDLSCSIELKEIPDLSQATNLEELDLSHCYSLVKLPSPFSSLKKLTRLSTRGCRNLEFLPSTAGLTSLKVLDSGACSSLRSFPELSTSIVELYLYETKIKELLGESIWNLTALKVLNLSRSDELLVIPSMIGNLTALENLDISDCKKLLQIPNTIGNLSCLRKLNMRGCERLENIPNTIGNLTALVVLNLSHCDKLLKIPSMIGELPALQNLDLSGNKMLLQIPNTIGNLSCLRKLNMRGCEKLENIPNTIGNLTALQVLNLSRCGKLLKIPSMIGNLTALENLELSDCKTLLQIPDTIGNLSCLRKLNMRGCEKLENIPNTVGNLNALNILDLWFCKRLTNIPSTVGNSSDLDTLIISGCEMLSAIPLLSTFPYLRRLCLRNLNLLEVPEDIGCLRVLRHLDLSENDFETLPESIDQLFLLEELTLCNCKNLQSLLILPPDLKYLYANDCSSLESISSIPECSLQDLTLCNCFNLSDDAEVLVQRMISKPIHSGEFKNWAYLCLREKLLYHFNHQGKKRSLRVDLPQSSSAGKPVGFVVEIVVACETRHTISDFSVRCSWRGEANQTGHTYSFPTKLPSYVCDSSAESHVLLFFSSNFGEERSSGKILFDFELDCKMSYDSNCCQMGRCVVSFRFPEHNAGERAEKVSKRRYALRKVAGLPSLRSRNRRRCWASMLVMEDDLRNLQKLVEVKHGRTAWTGNAILTMDCSTPTFTFQAWRKDSEDVHPQYRSRTVFEDVTPQMARDFFWDEKFHVDQENMLIRGVTLEEDHNTRTISVQWLEDDPILPYCIREEIIGGRIWDSEGVFYCITKGLSYASAPRPPALDQYYSSWCIRAIESRRGNGQLTACEVLLFHHGDLSLPFETVKLGGEWGPWDAIEKIELDLRAYLEHRA